MALQNIKGVDFSNQRVLIRVDFNVELDNVALIAEHFKIEVSRETIDHILTFPGAKVALLTHLGRPDGKREAASSTERLLPLVRKALGREVVFVDECVGEKVEQALNNLPTDSVLLLENVRFSPEEERNDRSFSQALAKPFTVYVNEAFSVSHRSHASTVGVTEFLPPYAGLRVLKEVEELDRVAALPEHPAIAIIGGAKIETKLPLITALEATYDYILVGGKIANEAIDQNISFSPKVLLPQDFESSLRLDIGPNTITNYIQIIKTAKTIIWNGPLGKFEEKPYNRGTDVILRAILESNAYVVIGGGESLAMLENAGVLRKISFVSSGGGAMLEYLSGKKLPGLVVLEA